MSENDDDAADRLRRKKEFYDGLDSSTASDDDEEPDPGRQSSIDALRRGAARKQELAAEKKRNSNDLPRSVSDTNLAKKSQKPIVGGRPRPTTSDGGNKLPPSLTAQHTFSRTAVRPTASAVPSSSAVLKATGKRKRDSNMNQVPTNQQIFKGLQFYFFPNTDTNAARRMRIAKALEFGATWQKDFNDTVTHIVVDKAMDYSLLTKFLKRDDLPSHVVVVSENWPAECISYKILLNPKQVQFKVKGYEPAQTVRPVSTSSYRSLQVKPAGKAVKARQPETPSEGRRAPTPPAAVSSDDDDDDEVYGAPPTVVPSGKTATTKVQSTEEFDAAVRQARELQHVPLDNDEEGFSRPSSSEGPQTNDEQRQNDGLNLLKKKETKFQTLQDKFQCMQKHTGPNTTNPNAFTITILQQMADYYGQLGDEWRLRAYRKAIATLRNHPTKVWTREEALALPQVGERLASKIEEIAFTNRLRRLDSARSDPNDQILQRFMKVYGAGFAQASKWVSAGYTTLDELLEKADLTDSQRVGIEHYEDFNSHIPRAEVVQHGSIVRKALHKIDPAFEVIVGGSYRRGSETSGDIDCIITRPNTNAAHVRQVVLDQLVPKLFAKSFLVAELAATSRDDGSKWHGASQITSSSANALPKPWRRIDFLLVPSDELGAALIYFTGNDIFNRSLRLLASTKGMRLNQRGLYKDIIRGKGREKLSEGTLVEGNNERKIFEVLGVPWRPPEHRIC